ncbi:hypothetical protein IMCC26207_107161 [Actinobacteria bacterium IMCC26207]|nr:hypothetical protein IMCC26207_107161 [Actinobacteria bacterium IMCC26207]
MKFEDPPEIIGAGNLRKPSLTGANLTGPDLTGVIWLNTPCPNGVVQLTGCPPTP